MKMRWLPYSYLLHDNVVRTKNIAGVEGPHSNFDPGPALALDGIVDNTLSMSHICPHMAEN